MNESESERPFWKAKQNLHRYLNWFSTNHLHTISWIFISEYNHTWRKFGSSSTRLLLHAQQSATDPVIRVSLHMLTHRRIWPLFYWTPTVAAICNYVCGIDHCSGRSMQVSTCACNAVGLEFFLQAYTESRYLCLERHCDI